MKYTDPDGRSPISWFIPNSQKISIKEAQNWIDKNVCANSSFPICGEMYAKSRNGDSSKYSQGPDSTIAKAMANDQNAYVNKIILNRLKQGITSGKNGQTAWSNTDLKLSLGSTKFEWNLESYDEKTKTAVVSVTVTDTFDFNEESNKGTRSADAEKLTALGRKAGLTSYAVEVNYKLQVKVDIPKTNSNE